jgi:hypothetical protein
MRASPAPSITADTNGNTDNEVVIDDNYLFRGFLAWCLWGWIPIHSGAKIKSSLFTDAKANASHGRKILSRQALKSAKHAAYRMPVDVAAAKKVLGEQVIPDTPSYEELTAHRESTGMLEMALELFKADFAEKELQKRSYLEVLIVRDKLAAVTRKSDRLTDKFYRTKKGLAANEMKLLLDKYDEEIEVLEQQLQNIQKAEMKRRQSASSATGRPSVAGGSTTADSTSAAQESTVKAIRPTIVIEDLDFCPAVATTRSPSDGTQPTKSSVCIECNVTPSTHKCRKCREFICDLCCSSKRN